MIKISNNSNPTIPLPKRWKQLKQKLVNDEWILDRVSESHHIFTKVGRRCIPLAFHGGTMSPQYATLILKQAEIGSVIGNEVGIINYKEGGENDNTYCRRRIKIRYKPLKVPLENKVEIDEDNRQRKQEEHLHIEHQRQSFERNQRSTHLNEKRTKLLEKVQVKIAAGEYKTAIDLMESVEINEFGSSCNLYDFNCNILFYRLVSIEEYALSLPDFNSKRQRDEITKTLSLSTRIMDNSPERRNEIRDFVSKLQQRIVSKYMSGLLDIAGYYK